MNQFLHLIAAVPQSTNAFVSDSNFSSVFGATEPAGMFICLRKVQIYLMFSFVVEILAQLNTRFNLMKLFYFD